MDCLGVLEEIQRSEPLTYWEMDIIKQNHVILLVTLMFSAKPRQAIVQEIYLCGV